MDRKSRRRGWKSEGKRGGEGEEGKGGMKLNIKKRRGNEEERGGKGS